MKKILSILLMCFLLSGCSFLKIASAPLQVTKNSVPQSIIQSQAKMICSKNAVFNEDGLIISCGGKYYNYEQNKSQQDRKLTFWEKVNQMFTRGLGYIVWLVIISVILTAMGCGVLVSNFWQAVFGTGKVLKQVVRGVQEARKNNKDLSTALNESTDENVKNFLIKFKQENNIK